MNVPISKTSFHNFDRFFRTRNPEFWIFKKSLTNQNKSYYNSVVAFFFQNHPIIHFRKSWMWELMKYACSEHEQLVIEQLSKFSWFLNLSTERCKCMHKFIACRCDSRATWCKDPFWTRFPKVHFPFCPKLEVS